MIRLSIFAFLSLATINAQSDDQSINQSIGEKAIDAIIAARNTSVNPCENFYEYSCGGWMNNTQLPSDLTRFTRSFNTIEQENDKVLKQLLESNLPTVGPFYESCMDVESIDNNGIEPLAVYINQTYDLSINQSAYWKFVGDLKRHLDVSVMFDADVEVNQAEPKKQWLSLSQGGLSLPTLSMYDDKNITDGLREHIKKILSYAGEGDSEAQVDADRIVDWELALSKFSSKPAQRRDPFKLFNPVNVSDLELIAPNIDWRSWIEGLNLQPNTFDMNLADPAFFRGLSQLIEDLGENRTSTLQAVARWRILHDYARDLPEEFRVENFEFFDRRLDGQKEMKPRFKHCTSKATNLLNKLMDAYYMNQTFGGNSQNATQELIHQLTTALSESISRASWMDEPTRAEAMNKVSLIIDNIGGNSTLDLSAYNNVTINEDQHLSNIIQLTEYKQNETFSRLFKPTDRHRWEMTASTVNAYYSPETNTINFPAAILQAPFFNADYPVSLQLAGIGMVIGHELSHGLDDQGRLFTGEGKLRDWWSSESARLFNERSNCFREQYSNYSIVLDGTPEAVNGNLTAGENIADNVGIQVAYDAFLRSQEPSDEEKRLFFSAYASDWCQISTVENAKQLLADDPHSPAEARVNVPLSNFAAFSEAFNCPVGSRMNPPDKCQLY